MSAASSTRTPARVLAAAAAFMLLLAGMFWLTQEQVDSDPAVLRPAHTQRARLQPTPSGASDASPTSEQPEAERETLRVLVRTGPRRRRDPRLSVGFNFRPKQWFPVAEEMGLQDVATVRLVDEVLERNSGLAGMVDPQDLSTLVASAQNDGLLLDSTPDASQPWLALVAVLIEHIRVSAAYQAALEAFIDSEGQGERPQVDRSRELQQAAALVEAHPDHPVAEFAQLFVLHALDDATSNTYDPDAAMPLATELVQSSPDVLVRDAAASSLLAQGAHGTQLPVWEQEALALEMDSLAYGGAELAFYLLEQARLSGESDRIRVAFDRYEQVVEQTCPNTGWHERMHLCDGLRRDVQAVQAELLGRGAMRPTDWREAIVRAVTRCSPSTDARVSGHFDADWRWRAEEDADALAACLNATPTPDLRPSHSVLLDVSVQLTSW